MKLKELGMFILIKYQEQLHQMFLIKDQKQQFSHLLFYPLSMQEKQQ
jgi:hypothetical protein